MAGVGNIQEIYGSSVQNADEEEPDRSCYYSCSNPRGTMHRFIALFFMCFLGFGSYFCYDNPAALMDYFSKDLSLTTTQFTMLYSLYSWPNIILCFIGGFLIDRVFGIRLGTNLYMFITLLGQLLFATGVILDTFWIMVLGRFIFGIGGESLAVAQNNYAVIWFKGKELNMVFGLQLSFARVGSAVNFLVMEPIYKWVNKSYEGYECLGIVIFLCTITCVLSMICSLFLGCMDKRADRILRRTDNATGDVVQLRDITGFPVTFWIITIICVSYYVAIFPFIALGKNFFMTRFHLDSETANFVNSIVYGISAFASPLLGFCVDKTGRNVFYVFISIVTTMIAHLILNFSMLTPYVAMVIMGLSYSMLASGLWPLVALIIPDHQLGTAYGICQAVQNLGLAVISICTGLIVDSGGYFWVEVFFIISLGVALLATFVVWILDSTRGGMLNMSPGERDKREQDSLEAEREKLLSSAASSSSTDHQQNSDFHIRNRYLSRIGAALPSNYSITTKGLVYRALR